MKGVEANIFMIYLLVPILPRPLVFPGTIGIVHRQGNPEPGCQWDGTVQPPAGQLPAFLKEGAFSTDAAAWP